MKDIIEIRNSTFYSRKLKKISPIKHRGIQRAKRPAWTPFSFRWMWSRPPTSVRTHESAVSLTATSLLILNLHSAGYRNLASAPSRCQYYPFFLLTFTNLETKKLMGNIFSWKNYIFFMRSFIYVNDQLMCPSRGPTGFEASIVFLGRNNNSWYCANYWERKKGGWIFCVWRFSVKGKEWEVKCWFTDCKIKGRRNAEWQVQNGSSSLANKQWCKTEL